jgi:hypothetical protein
MLEGINYRDALQESPSQMETLRSPSLGQIVV